MNNYLKTGELYDAILPALGSIRTRSEAHENDVKRLITGLQRGIVTAERDVHYSFTKFAAKAASTEFQLIDDTQDKQQGVTSFEKCKIDANETFLVLEMAIGHNELAAATKIEEAEFKYLATGGSKMDLTVQKSELRVAIEGAEVMKTVLLSSLLNNAGQDSSKYFGVKPYLIKGGQIVKTIIKMPTNVNATGGGNKEFFGTEFHGFRFTTRA